nr:GNAT family N-acetyltransferase [uncultured Cohaesibacter sp.]
MTLSNLSPALATEQDDAEKLLYAGFYDYARGAGREAPGPFEEIAAQIDKGNVLFWRGRTGIVVFEEGSAPGRVMLSLFALHPDKQKSGLGAAMMDDAVSFARKAGYREMELYTLQQYEHLRRFYERQGFVLERVGPRKVKPDGKMRIFMVKSLDASSSEPNASACQ